MDTTRTQLKRSALRRDVLRRAVLRRAVAATVLVATAAAGLALSALAAPAAQADPGDWGPSIGTVVGSPVSGPTTDTGRLVTSAACPAGTKFYAAAMYFDADGNGDYTGPQDIGDDGLNVVISTNNLGLSSVNTDGIPLDNNFLGLATQGARTLVNGKYLFQLRCHTSSAAIDSLGRFQGTLVVSGGTGSGAGTRYQWETPTPVGPVATTTILAVSPTGSAVAGAPVTLTATVSPSAPGTVQFKDGANAVGTAVTVDAGRAATTTSALGAGLHSLTATFTPADPLAFGSSTSAATSYTVTAAPGQTAQATTTALAVTPATGSEPGRSVTLQATVTPSGAAGSVTFLDGATALGGSVSVVGGVATTSTSALSAGGHSLKARFVPTDPAAFAASASADVPFTVTAPSTGPTATTTTIGASAATGVSGSSVTFTATVAPAAAAGSVQFTDNVGATAVPLGPAQPLTGGKATLTTSSLAVGAHQVSATFVPASADLWGASTSTVAAHTVTAAGEAVATTTRLKALAPVYTFCAPAQRGWSRWFIKPCPTALLLVQVTPETGGTVTVLDGRTEVAKDVQLWHGVALVTVRPLTGGTHSFTAVFKPADPTKAQPSTSSAATLTVPGTGR